MKTINPNLKVLTITWYVADNWYGKRYRMVLMKSETEDFESAKECKPLRSLLAKYVNVKRKQKVTAKWASYGILSTFPTYTYCSMGPSYSCDNSYITLDELMAWKESTESSYEYQEKQRMNAYKKENRKMLKQRKLEAREKIKRERLAAAEERKQSENKAA